MANDDPMSPNRTKALGSVVAGLSPAITEIAKFNSALRDGALAKALTSARLASEALYSGLPQNHSTAAALATFSGAGCDPEHVRVALPPPESPQPRIPLSPATDIRSTDRLGALVREAREAAGLSQQRLADASGVGRRFVSELENGKPTLEFSKVIAVANAIGIDLFARQR